MTFSIHSYLMERWRNPAFDWTSLAMVCMWNPKSFLSLACCSVHSSRVLYLCTKVVTCFFGGVPQGHEVSGGGFVVKPVFEGFQRTEALSDISIEPCTSHPILGTRKALAHLSFLSQAFSLFSA